MPTAKEINAYFDPNPACNVGIVLGTISALVGLDIDSPRGSFSRTSSALNRVPWTPALAASGAVLVIYIVLWVTTAPASTGIGSLLVVVAAMAGIKLLAAGGADRSCQVAGMKVIRPA